ncbi:DUF1254 domain-containing protein [Paraburkholderia sp. IW21]|uniref:DUF1254 domain-containing protein n=1 Tax=Paraburkholderia sp. IW21 TaxID=3242488 RepID=UPI003521F4F3
MSSSSSGKNLTALARDAVLYTLPLFEMARMRAAMCPRRDDAGQFAGDSPYSTHGWVNQLVRGRQLLGPRNREVVTPNNDTLYISTWLDVGDEPLVLEVPETAGRYYVLGLLDFYTNPFESIGTRTKGSGARRFLLHHGDVAPPASGDLTPIACPTRDIWLIGRVLVDGPDDLPAVHDLQDRFVLKTLGGQPAQRRFDVGMARRAAIGDPRRYAAVVNTALARNPPPASESALVAQYGAVGIGADIDASALAASTLAALATALDQVIDELGVPQPSALGGGWFLPVEVRASFGDDYLTRAHVSRNYIGALGMEEAMYVSADCDSEGRPLDGRYTYELSFPSDGLPQAQAFWSITMYDKTTCMLVDNAIDRYSIGDRSPHLRYDEQGLSLHLSAVPPVDASTRSNWLPAPNGLFYIMLRIYIPGAAHLEQRFRYPPVRRVECQDESVHTARNALAS